jgi:transposase
VLGEEFDGVLGCDCFSAYRRYMRECDVRVQFCLAHLIREVKFLGAMPDESTRSYGTRLLGALRRLFAVIHRREEMSAGEFDVALRCARSSVLFWASWQVPASAAAQRLAARMKKYGASYFEFITTPGIEPTNNVAEQAMRFVVIDRHITQGTRSQKGQRFCERIWTVVATCTQRGLSVWQYLQAAVKEYFEGGQAPSLLAEEV